jgi:hypothetical protein
MVFDGAAAIELLLLVCCVSTLLPISQSGRAHWPKPTKLLDFDVVGPGGLECGIQRLPLYQLLARLTTGLTLLACYSPSGTGTLASGY